MGETYELEESLPHVGRILAVDGACLSLQNGVDVLPRMRAALVNNRAYQGATSFAGTATAVARVRLTGSGTTWQPAAMPQPRSSRPGLPTRG